MHLHENSTCDMVELGMESKKARWNGLIKLSSYLYELKMI